MQIHKVTFKNLTEEQSFHLFKMLEDFGLPHDLEIMDNDFEFNETTLKAYKEYKKALNKQKNNEFKNK